MRLALIAGICFALAASLFEAHALLPLGHGGVGTVGLQIQNIALSNSIFTPNVANGSVGAVTVTLSDGTTCSGACQLTIVGVSPGNNTGKFHLSGTASGSLLEQESVNGTPAGTYNDFAIVVNYPAALNSPQQLIPTVTGVGFTQSIVSVSPTVASFVGGVGSANRRISIETATMNPASPAFTGSWSLQASEDFASFAINSSTGALSVGPSDIVAGSTFHVTAIATEGGVGGSPFTLRLTLTSTSGPTPPPAVAAQGYTQLALDSNWTTGNAAAISIDYNNTGAAGFQWYVSNGGNFYTPNCLGNGGTGNGDGSGGLTYPVTDQGFQVLQTKWSPTCQGFHFGRRGVVSENQNGSSSTNFPSKMATECRVRFAWHALSGAEIDYNPTSGQTPAPWYNCWAWGAGTGGTGINYFFDELDNGIEVHGAFGACSIVNGCFGHIVGGFFNDPASTTQGGATNSAVTSFQGNCCFTTNNSTFPPSQYHTFLMILTLDGASAQGDLCAGFRPCRQADVYIDNTWVRSQALQDGSGTSCTSSGCPSYHLQRNILYNSTTVGCGSEGVGDCANVPITGATNCSGSLCLQIAAMCTSNVCFDNFFENTGIWYISGVGGNLPDNSYSITWQQPGSSGCNPCSLRVNGVSYAGGYTGSGSLGGLKDVARWDQFQRVWVPAGCDWKNTQC